MQVLEFPNISPEPIYRIHPITMSDRLRDMRIVHNLPEGQDFKDFVTHFHESLDQDNPLVLILDLSFRDYLRRDSFTHDEALKYRLGILVARIVANTQLVDDFNKSIDSPEIVRDTISINKLREQKLSRFVIRNFYESDEHPEEIKAQIRHEVGHIISPVPETAIDWFTVGLGDGHAVISTMLGENLDLQTEPLDLRDLPFLTTDSTEQTTTSTQTTDYEDR